MKCLNWIISHNQANVHAELHAVVCSANASM